MMVLTQVLYLRFFCSPTPNAPATTFYIIAYALSWFCSSSLGCFAATHASSWSTIVEGHPLVTTVAVYHVVAYVFGSRGFSIWRWHDYHPCRWLQSRVRQVMDVSLWPEMAGDNRTPSHIRQNMPSTKWIHYSKDGHPQRTRDCNTVISHYRCFVFGKLKTAYCHIGSICLWNFRIDMERNLHHLRLRVMLRWTCQFWA